MATVQRSCEPLDEAEEESGEESDEEGAEANEADEEGGPRTWAPGEAGPSLAPVSPPKGKMKLQDSLEIPDMRHATCMMLYSDVTASKDTEPASPAYGSC